jgi:hypothetical protein
MTGTNDTITIMVVGACIIAALIVLSTVCYLLATGGIHMPQSQFTVTPTPTPIPTPVPTPEPIVVTAPSTLTFTVLKASAAQLNAVNEIDRHYTILTTDGAVLIMPDYYSWDGLMPQQSYTCDVNGAPQGYGRTVYTVNGCNVYKYPNYIQVITPIHQYNDYNRYDYYDCYDRNTGKYNRWCGYDDTTDNDRPYHDWDGNTYTFYHYRGLYWRCASGTCESITLSRVPAYVTILEAAPPFSRNH